MRRGAVALASLIWLAPAPVAGSESYLAYQVRIARGEAHYRLDAGLSRLAELRAREYALNERRAEIPHRQLTEVPCAWGEILGWSARQGNAGIRWVMAAWHRSPTHEAVLSSRWARYGVGVYDRAGRSYMAVVFAQCRL